MKQERSKVKSDILLRVRLLYVLFILAGVVVLARLVWVQLFSSEVAFNADRLASRIFIRKEIPAQRGSILSRDGEPLATSIFRYQAAFDFASPGLDSLDTFREQADSLAKLLAAFFKDKPASAYARMLREEHARRYRLVRPGIRPTCARRGLSPAFSTGSGARSTLRTASTTRYATIRP